MQRGENFRRFVPESGTRGTAALENEIYRCMNGSHLYGTAVESSDQDQLGIFIEPADCVMGFSTLDHWENKVHKSQDDKTLPGEIEVKLYSLRKYVGLAIVGNPSILSTLFAPPEAVLLNTEFGQELISRRGWIVSKQAHRRYLGYLQSQKDRFLGKVKGHKPRRPELDEKYGYDTKFAMHAVRLGLEGIQLMETGAIVYPSLDRDFLLSIRNGEYSYETMSNIIDQTEANLIRAGETTKLPDDPPYLKEFEKWLIDVHIYRWTGKRYV